MPVSAPVLTVRHGDKQGGSPRTFAPGSDVVVGRDLRADVRIPHPLVSRAHVLLRFDPSRSGGRWIALDNGSLNGIYVHGRRVPEVDLADGTTINLGNPDGPPLQFEVGRHQGSAGRPPQTSTVMVPPPIPSQPMPRPPVSGPQAYYPTQPPTQPPPMPPRTPPPRPVAPDAAPTKMGPSPTRAASNSNLATSMLKVLRPGSSPPVPPGAMTIGRAGENDIVIPDVLASRHHATLIPTPAGMEIVDNRSINGTFVNGARVDTALLRDGDVVTIGNVDLVLRDGILLRRSETAAATGTGGLEVRAVTWTIEGNKTLLDNISLAARPGTLTALIGPSGAGKSTLARLIAGYTHPTSGTVSGTP